MNDMTIGQRISRERKKLGLSQEALGEKVGVSRQAISKWEADSAVPEIDKLIALSKLFGVSVGWLLGVEAEQAEAAPALSDEQLETIERIVEKYQQPPSPRQPSLPGLLALGAMALALLLSVIALVKAGDNSQINALQGQLAHLTTNYYNLQNNFSYLSSQLSQMAEGEKLLSEYDFSATALEDLSGARVAFNAIPNARQGADWGALSVRRDGVEIIRADCDWDGTAYTAAVDVPAADGYEYYFIQFHQDGSQEQQKLDAESSYYYAAHVQTGLEFICGIYPATYAENTTTMQIMSYAAFLSVPPLTAEGVQWKYADLIFLHNGKEVLRSSILNAVEADSLPDDSGTTSVAVPAQPVDVDATELNIEKNCVFVDFAPDLKPGDTVVLKVSAKLSNGMVLEQTIGSWNIS